MPVRKHEAQQGNPLVGAHVRGRPIKSHVQVTGKLTKLSRREQRTQGSSEAGTADEALGHEIAIQSDIGSGNQGSGPQSQVEQGGVDGGRRTKGRGRDAGKQSGVPAWIQKAGNERVASAAIRGEALYGLTLNDQVGVLGRINAAGQLGDNVSRDVEREVGADLIGSARQLARQEVRLDERYVGRVLEPPFKSAKDTRINLVGHDMPAVLRKVRCERTCPGPDIEDEVVGRE